MAMIFMVCDHINSYIFNYKYSVLFYLGRISLPLFIYSFSYSFSFINSTDKVKQISIKLLVFALLSQLPYFFLHINHFAYGVPVNILFLFFLFATMVLFFKKNLIVISFSLMFFSIFVEYDIRGLLLMIGFYLFYLENKNKYQKYLAIFFIVIGFTGLCFINGNLFCLLSIPIILLIKILPFKIPRIKNFYYYFYPLHLSIILIIKFNF